MLIEDQYLYNKSITVSVLGSPNVGKSSLINYLIGVDLSVVTHRAQTTRNRFNCIFTIDHTEVILVDTPGLHQSSKEINKRMNQQALDGVFGADLNLLLIDLSAEIMPQFLNFKKNCEMREDFELGPTMVVFTKSDRIKSVDDLPLAEVVEKAKEVLPSIESFQVLNSINGDGVHLLTGDICDRAKMAPHRYPKGNISNKNEKFFAAEYIREQAFLNLKEELPYEVAVLIENFEEEKDEQSRKRSSIKITATILVNRPSQRAIVVGAKGSMIKEIGMNSRKKIEILTGCTVHLNLHVKVSPRWFKNNMVLEEIGLYRARNSARVWHNSQNAQNEE